MPQSTERTNDTVADHPEGSTGSPAEPDSAGAGGLLWSIGDPARGEAQFSQLWESLDSPDEIRFVIGESDPGRDWPRFHPGPYNGAAGFRELTATVEFEGAQDLGDGWHSLELKGFAHVGPCPDLLVEVNGHRAFVAVRPSRSTRGYFPGITGPIAGPFATELAIPPGTLRPGRNVISLTSTSERPDPVELAANRHYVNGGGGELHWAGVALRRRPSAPEAAITVVPLPLYLEDPAGGLKELVDLMVVGAPDLRSATATVTVGGHRFELPDPADGREFGDLVVRLEVPEWEGEAPVEVMLDLPGGPLTYDNPLRPARKWTVHVVPHVHLDVGYTDYQASVLEVHSSNIDGALDIVKDNPDYAFSADGSLVAQEFLRTRSAGQGEDLIRAMRDGQVGISAWWAQLLTGLASLEELYRGLYLAARLDREHGVPLRYANLTDVPSYSWAVPSVLAAAGVEAFMGIPNHARAGNEESDIVHLQSPMRWEGPDGAAMVTFFADHYLQLRLLAGEFLSVAGISDGLCRFLDRYERDDYLPHDVPVVGTHSDNNEISDGYADVVTRWNERFAWPRLRFSTIGDYLESVQPLADRLPALHGDGGSYWEDGAGAHAQIITSFRRTQALLPAVEALTALVTGQDGRFAADTAALDRAWEGQLLGSEHTWASSHATQRPHSAKNADQIAWKVARIEQGRWLALDEGRRALSHFGAAFGLPDSRSLLVFNAASWSRDLEVDVDLPVAETLGSLGFEELDEPRDGQQTRRYRVQDVPAFGYRLLPIVPLPEPVPDPVSVSDAAAWDEQVPEVLVTPHYEVAIEPLTGRVTGLRHRGLDRELLDPGTGWGLGELLYVAGGGTEQGRGMNAESTQLTMNDPYFPAPELTVIPSETRKASLRRTQHGWTLVTEGSAPSIPGLRTEIRFHEDTDRVDVTVTFDKEPVLAKESVYVAFPFAVADPVVHYDRQQGWVDPARDHYPGACNEWFTTQNAVTVTDPDLTVTWTSADAPLFTVGDIVRATWPRTFTAGNGTLCSWVMNNYWRTNTPASQSGRVELHYSFRADRNLDLAAAGRFGRDRRLPALTTEVQQGYPREPNRPPDTGQLFRTELPDHLVATAYVGRWEADLLVRVQEVAGRGGTGTLWHPNPGPAATAHRCTAVEQPVEQLPVDTDGKITLDLGPHEVVTIALGHVPGRQS
ncbi:Glycosyl hydrolases family 38 C-terminal domain-containing protein [Actinopolymorpha cephalotaxi]|uniref:Glycosyl hydrolases family 38 C-terminal domain-containing protein n=1 Tax=Actinopolymorpha cephalotaxi TaxID=504797 RepID=A0A1I2ZZF1_9ACTN|nr:hypothetical protein [Actinopolymorpha cephalotaxi]NYH84222.1 hypothetical protein [Actinopolymorpha cephalotaxi]SFH42451.1 Glycosyl hydrolases family 38 C-terminal domain-containing protein [Actinopolymorpha cephalotaxi]